MATSCAYEFQLKHFGFADATAEDFYVSQWSSNKIAFVIYRTIVFVYWTGWIIYASIEYSWLENAHLYYLYLSHWGEWSLVLHFGISLAVAIYGLVTRKSQSGNRACCIWNKCNKGDLRWFHHLSWIVRTAATTICYLITIVFWSFDIASRASPAVNVHRHAMNSVLATLDLFTTRVPVRLLHLVYSALFGAIYTIFTLILHGAEVRSRFYDVIIDWEQIPGISAGVSLGIILVLAPLLHAVTFGFSHLRGLIARRCGCHDAVTYIDDDVSEGDVNAVLETVEARV